MAAHAVNMGLFRIDGAIQGLTNREDWQAIGYDFLEGDFTRVGQHIRIHRPETSNAHPFDTNPILLEQATAFAPLVVVHTFQNDEQERQFLVDSIKADLERGFLPDDLMVVALDNGSASKKFLDALEQLLQAANIPAHQGVDNWKKEGSIPLGSVYRAKGNEADRVYACRFEYVHRSVNEKTEVHARNGAFVAMTRARLWVTVSSGGDAPVLDEIVKAQEQYPNLEFDSFTQRSLQRVLEIALDDSQEILL